jgi:hypothetical protein
VGPSDTNQHEPIQAARWVLFDWTHGPISHALPLLSLFFPHDRSGCQTCDNGVWDRNAGGYSCGARISWAMIVDQDTQADACTKVSDQYPQCAQCTYFFNASHNRHLATYSIVDAHQFDFFA